MNALIGYTGFVGSYLIDKDMDFYNSKNIDALSGKHYDTVYCSGLYAEKWKANKYPQEDIENIKRLQTILSSINCKRFVLISTVDVFNQNNVQTELSTDYASHPYGKHRLVFEDWISETFKNVYIFRLPALFGNGLKKNGLYDLMHNNQTEKLRSDWKFQWYNLQWLKDDIQYHVSKDHHLVHLVTEPVTLGFIQRVFFPKTSISKLTDSNVNYNVRSIYESRHSLEDMLSDMNNFIHLNSKYLVSEIGWGVDKDSIMSSFLKSNGLETEIAPSKHNWDMSYYTNNYSAQSILYGVNIQIFKEQDKFLEIMSDRLQKLQQCGTKRVIFGSPKQRIYTDEDAVGLFRRLGDICKSADIVLCVENNSRHYGCNWLCKVSEVIEFVKTVDHTNIRVNLDTGSMLMEDETDVTDINLIGHIQISFPKLGKWNSPDADKIRQILDQLNGYSGKISLEALNIDFDDIYSFMKLMNLR
jgi:dTDP-4-dehydrorhamnose reductase